MGRLLRRREKNIETGRQTNGQTETNFKVKGSMDKEKRKEKCVVFFIFIVLVIVFVIVDVVVVVVVGMALCNFNELSHGRFMFSFYDVISNNRVRAISECPILVSPSFFHCVPRDCVPFLRCRASRQGVNLGDE